MTSTFTCKCFMYSQWVTWKMSKWY